MKKQLYFKIQFENCPDVEFEYTICRHIDDIEDYLYNAESSLMDYKNAVIKISPIWITEKEYQEFIKEAELA